jgi:cyanate lyase
MSKIEHKLREDICGQLLEAKRLKNLTFQQIADKIGRDKVWVATAMHNHATFDEKEVRSLCEVLDIKSNLDYFITMLTQPPFRHPPEGFQGVCADPTIYRLYEFVNNYGEPLKALIHEEFGDGIMSAIGLQVNLKKEKKDDGEHVVITLDGKFLPYKKW